MVVLFEDAHKKVELHLRAIKLKRVLAEKMFELRSLEHQEKRVLAGTVCMVYQTTLNQTFLLIENWENFSRISVKRVPIKNSTLTPQISSGVVSVHIIIFNGGE